MLIAPPNGRQLRYDGFRPVRQTALIVPTCSNNFTWPLARMSGGQAPRCRSALCAGRLAAS